ncbi:MAG: 4Fe-4S dicluster domain-containing protein [Candidatus Syntropharchaeales archaeon]
MRRLAIGKKFPVEVLEDPRAEDIGLLRCMQCGRCTGGCPAAGVFEDFSPRLIMHELIEGETENVLKGDMIWKCGQCYTCHLRCPRGNSPAMVILILRELSLKRGYSKDKVKEIAAKCGVPMWKKGVNFYEEGSRELPDEAAYEVEDILRRSGYEAFLKALGVDLP